MNGTDTILLRHITVASEPRDILISHGMIRTIAPAGSLSAEFADVEDCTGKVAVPGLVNMHTHAGMALMRGVCEDEVFSKWIDRIWEIEGRIDENFVYWGTKVACIEMIKTGTTTFNDHYWFSPMAHKAAAEMGLRGLISYVVLDKSNPAEAERQKKQCQRMYEESRIWNDNSIFEIAFHAVYSVSEEMVLWAAEFAREHNLFLHIHLSETEKEVRDCKAVHCGMSPVEYLDSLGVLGPNVIAAHTLWLSGHDIEILAKRGVTCVHNINSNAKLASGYKFLYNELRDAGANICIGTDGCASSNNLDLLEAMKTAALFQKAWRNDPKALPLGELMDMATVNAAKALKLNIGVISEGALADLCIVDTDNSWFLSPGSFEANLIYSSHSDCIDSVIAGGRFVMRHRIIPGEKEILHEARKVLKQII